MKSMVKILVTIMALSLAEAPVFAAWPTGVAKVLEKVAHLKEAYPEAIAEINALGKKPTHNQLNALEARLSAPAVAPAVVPAPVGEVMGMVVVGGAGLEARKKHGREEDEVVGGIGLGLGGALEVEPVGAKRKRIPYTGVDCPVPASELQVAPTQREMDTANGKFVLAKADEESARGRFKAVEWHCTNVFGDKSRKEGVTKDPTSGNLAKFTITFEGATHARRQAEAQHAFLLTRNTLSLFFDRINQQLGALTAPDAVVTAADINAFIAMIEEVIGAVISEDGIMSPGAKAEFATLMIPYADYATELEAYVCDLRAAVAAGKFAQSPDLVVVEQRGGYAQRVRQILFSSGALIAAATLAGAVVGYHGAPEIIVAGFVRGIISQEAFEGVQVLVISASALVGGSVARLATGGPAVVRDSSSAGEKRRHGGDDNV